MKNINEEVGVTKQINNVSGTLKITQTQKDYEKLSQIDKQLQSFIDKKVSQALKTAKIRWDKEIQNRFTEYKKNQYTTTTQDKLINMINQNNIFDLYLTILKFETMNTEKIKNTIKIIEKLQRQLEKLI